MIQISLWGRIGGAQRANFQAYETIFRALREYCERKFARCEV
jgi:hypothetical protein